MSGDDEAPTIRDGWTLAQERRLGDHIQRAICERPPPELATEDREAERIMREAMRAWSSYETLDDE